jgi:predicted PurR-regulated permease PerM
MVDEYFKKVLTSIILVGLLILSYFLLKPILMAIIIGVILAFLFSPLYNIINKRLKMKDLTAFILSIFLVLIIVIPLWYLAPVMITQSIKFYAASQQIDFITPFQNIFPSLFQSESFSNEIASALRSFVTKTTNSMTNSLSNIILNFPTIFLELLIVFFTFYFVLRDKDDLISYIQSLLPFSKEVERKLFKSSRDITLSVLYGQVIIGIVQGLVAGIGFFIFKVPNALLLTALAALAGIFPVIGTTIVWIPVVIYLLVAGNPVGAIGVAIFGVISSIIENFVKPAFVSRRTQMNSSVILIGMIGGIFMFGILGVILGPLILAYLLIVLEVYRDKKLPGAFIEPPKETEK